MKGWRGRAAGSVNRELPWGVKSTLVTHGFAEWVTEQEPTTAPAEHPIQRIRNKRNRKQHT